MIVLTVDPRMESDVRKLVTRLSDGFVIVHSTGTAYFIVYVLEK